MDDASGGWNAVASEFITHRSPTIGVATVRNWASALPSGASILDLGCGHGFPVSAALVDDGYDLYGIDASPRLVSEFRRRLPIATVACESVEISMFFNRRFDAAIAIGLIFLLGEDAQRSLIRRVSGALKTGGKFLFNAPAQDVEWMDMLTGRRSRSLGDSAYASILNASGFELTDHFTDEGENHYYSAARIPQAAG